MSRPGSNLGRYVANTFDGCLRLCANDPRCNAFDFIHLRPQDGNQNDCYTKQSGWQPVQVRDRLDTGVRRK